MGTTRSYFRAVDALRGPAALCIAVFHFYSQWAGYLAVEFFFVLSGFLLASSVRSRAEELPVGRFLARRIARLYPMHLFSLATFGLSVWILTGGPPSYPDGTMATLIQQVTLTHGIGLNQHGLTWNYPNWAISVEFWMGLLVYLLLIKRVRPVITFPVSLACYCLIAWHNGSLATNYHNYAGVVNSGLLRGLGSLLLGALAYGVYDALRHNQWGTARWTLLEVVCIVAAVFVILCRSQVTSYLDFFAPFVFAAGTVVFACEGGLVSEVLCRVSGFGAISYSIYLNQATILLYLRPVSELLDLPIIAGLVLYLALLVLYSFATYRWIELPARVKLGAVLDNRSSRLGRKRNASREG